MSARPPAHHCPVHDLACGPDGRCVLCRRADPPPPPSAGSRVMVAGLVVLALAVGGALATKIVRGMLAAERAQAEAEAKAAAEIPAGRIRLYTTSWCPHCKRAKEWLADRRVEYVEIDVERNPALAREHRKVNPRGSIPTLDADGEVVVGFSAEEYQRAIARSGRGK